MANLFYAISMKQNKRSFGFAQDDRKEKSAPFSVVSAGKQKEISFIFSTDLKQKSPDVKSWLSKNINIINSYLQTYYWLRYNVRRYQGIFLAITQFLQGHRL